MIKNIIGKTLSLFRYRDKPDPFKLFSKLRIGEVLPPRNSKAILVLPIRVSPASNLFEGIYGYALRLRGYTVHALLCGGAINKCDNMTVLKDGYFRCKLCQYEQSRFYESFGLVGHYFNELLDKCTINAIIRAIDSTDTNELFNLRYDDCFFGNHIEMSVVRYLLSSKVNLDKNSKLIRHYAYSTLISYEVTKRLINKVNPEFVLLSHGVYSTWGGGVVACKKAGVHAVIWGRGYIQGNIIADHDESYIFKSVTEPPESWKNLSLTNRQKEKLKRYFFNKRNPKKTDDYVNYYADVSLDSVRIQENFEAAKSNTKFALFPNIPWDGTTFSASKEFPSIKHFLNKTIQWFLNHPEHVLYIRSHPAEVADKYNLTQETTKDILDIIVPVLPNNVIFIPPDSQITSYDVAQRCDVNLLFASTIGLELAFDGKIVIQTGQSMISNKGFIYEANTGEEYFQLLEMAANKELTFTAHMKENVEKYAYHWLYRRHMPDSIYSHKLLTFTGYNIRNSMDLSPGNMETVDWFIERCFDGKPFIWDEHEKLLEADISYSII